MASILQEAGTVCPSRVPGFHPRFLMGSALFIVLVFCVVFFVLLVFVLCLLFLVYTTNIASVSGLSILDCPPLVFSRVYIDTKGRQCQVKVVVFYVSNTQACFKIIMQFLKSNYSPF